MCLHIKPLQYKIDPTERKLPKSRIWKMKILRQKWIVNLFISKRLSFYIKQIIERLKKLFLFYLNL